MVNRKILLVLAASLTPSGCFDPKAQVGLRCDNGFCPPGQICVSVDPDGDDVFEDICQLEGDSQPDGGTPALLSFQEAQTTPTGQNPYSIIVADVTDDGRDDIIMSAGSIGVHVLVSLGNGMFNDLGSFPGGDGDSLGIAVGDMNGDQAQDVVFVYPQLGDNQVAMAINDPKNIGTFAVQPAVALPGQGGTLRNIVLAHLNGDQALDVLAWDFDSQGQSLIQEVPGQSFAPPTNFDVTGQIALLATGDVDLDGSEDLVTAGLTGLHAALQFEPGGYSGPMSYFGGQSLWFEAADLNGDDRNELIISTIQGIEVLVHSNTDNVYETPVVASNVQNAPQFDLADFNGDGSVDLLTLTGQIFLGESAEPGVFQDAGSVRSEPFMNPLRALAGDFNGDGKMDVAILDGGSPPAMNGFITVFLQE